MDGNTVLIQQTTDILDQLPVGWASVPEVDRPALLVVFKELVDLHGTGAADGPVMIAVTLREDSAVYYASAYGYAENILDHELDRIMGIPRVIDVYVDLQAHGSPQQPDSEGALVAVVQTTHTWRERRNDATGRFCNFEPADKGVRNSPPPRSISNVSALFNKSSVRRCVSAL